ncbi:MAG TPA: ABC transporter ATP-binding protein, partial [Actinopolymorphaceae bacterium]|nr:ABC transporter ATP-binding protein [Actinopolymorphaceae bacterium]
MPSTQSSQASDSDPDAGEVTDRRRHRLLGLLSRPSRPSLPPPVRGIVAVLALLPEVSRRRSALFAAGALAGALLPVGMAVVTGLLVGSIPAAVAGGLHSPAGGRTTSLLVFLAVLILLQRVISPLLSTLATILGREVDRLLQEKVITAVGRPSGIAHLEDPDVLDDVRLVRGLGMDATKPSLAIEALAWVVPSWLQALGSAAVLIAFHWWLGLVWLAAWPLIVYVMQREYIRVGKITYGQSSALRRSEYIRDLALHAPAAKEVRVWGMLGWLIDRFESSWRSAIEPAWRARKPRPRALFGSTGSVLVLNLTSYVLLAWAATRGDISLGALAVYTQALTGANAYAAFNDGNAHLSFAAVTVPKVLALERQLMTVPAPGAAAAASLDTGAATAAAAVVAADARPVGARASQVADDAPDREISFCDVVFEYPRTDRQALAGLSLVVPAHRSLAIVGENGAGKTSLVKLLCGLYEPTAGRITVDGADLRELDLAAWRRRVAVLFQDFARYHLPVRDNIGLGAPELAGDLDRLRSAAQKAGVLDVIESLPYGWETVLSREYSRGTDLS